MRTMFVLRGAPGAGKSTLIRRHRLGDLAVGLDDFRRLFSATFTDLDGAPTLSMTFGAEKQVVAASRIRQGATLLLDCTNPSRKSYREFASLARRCGYEVYVVDVQGDLTDAELIERNETRRGALGYVEPRVVADIAARVRGGAASVTERVVRLDDVRRLNTVEEIDASGYERVVVIGDVQSCAGALAKVKDFYGGWDPASLFVFVGDLFDRGPDAAGVMDLIVQDGAVPDNVVLVEGNHDEHMRMLIGEVRAGGWPDTRASRDQILAAGRSRGEIQALLARMVPLVGLRLAGEHILITHAGLDPATIDRIAVEGEDGLLAWDLTEVPMLQLLLGSSDRSTAFQGRSSYARAVEARGADASPIVVVDVGLPRTVDPACADVAGAVCFDLDDLDAAMAENARSRAAESVRAEALVARQTDAFLAWMQERDVIPTVKQMHGKARGVCASEAARAAKVLAALHGVETSEEERAVLEALASAVAKKLLHGPAARLRKQAGDPDAYRYTEAARYLFGLDAYPQGFSCRSDEGRTCRLVSGSACARHGGDACPHHREERSCIV